MPAWAWWAWVLISVGAFILIAILLYIWILIALGRSGRKFQKPRDMATSKKCPYCCSRNLGVKLAENGIVPAGVLYCKKCGCEIN